MPKGLLKAYICEEDCEKKKQMLKEINRIEAIWPGRIQRQVKINGIEAIWPRRMQRQAQRQNNLNIEENNLIIEQHNFFIEENNLNIEQISINIEENNINIVALQDISKNAKD